jgi:hypothetical protein
MDGKRRALGSMLLKVYQPELTFGFEVLLIGLEAAHCEL